MPEKLTTPSCEITGLPLPIKHAEPSNEAQYSFYDYHHHFHPRRDPELQGLSGRAVRYSRGQFLPRALHDRYHALFDGPELPHKNSERFRISVLACAGVVPREALDVSKKGDFKIVRLSSIEHTRLSSIDSVYPEKTHHPGKQEYIRNTIGQFFARYALQQDIHEVVSDKVIDEFLAEETRANRKKELGNFIMQEALGVAIEDVIPIHNEARQEGLMHPDSPHRRVQNVIRSFCMTRYFPDYYGEVSKSLLAR